MSISNPAGSITYDQLTGTISNPMQGISLAQNSAANFNFTTASDFDQRITFTRSTIANRFDSAGLLSQVAIDVARANANQDYNPATLAARGFLIEESRTNLALWCRDGTNAAWVKSNMTAAKTATGIDGVANSATTITATAGNATILQTVTSASAARATSCYVKRRTGTGDIEMTQDNGGTWTAVTATASWTRVEIPSATVTNPVFGFRVVTSGDEIDFDFFGLESATYPSSPILTTTASATRGQDNAAITNLSSIGFSATQGAVYVQFMLEGVGSSASRRVFSFDDTGTNNRMAVIVIDNGGDEVGFIVTVGGVQQALLTGPALTPLTLCKTAVAWDSAGFRMSVNGSTVAGATGSIPTVTQLVLGKAGNNSNWLNGWLPSLSYIPQGLSQAQLNAMTA